MTLPPVNCAVDGLLAVREILKLSGLVAELEMHYAVQGRGQGLY